MNHAHKAYYLYGRHAVDAALNNEKRQIRAVLCTDKTYTDYQQKITKYSHKVVTSAYLDKLLAGAVHQDIALQVLPITEYYLPNNISDDKIAILDQVTDPQNIGGIIRSAAAFGINTIIVPERNSPPENGSMAKAASGGLEKINLISVVNISQAIKQLKQQGFWIIGLDSETTQVINQQSLRGKVAMVLGAEGKGMRRLVRENCDLLLKIPQMSGAVQSLNVANAASIAFFIASQSGL